MDTNTQIQKTQDLPAEQTANEVVEQGRNRAKQLMDIVNQNQWAKNIQGKNYLQVEAWQTLGKFYGYTAKTVSTEFVEIGQNRGFNAVVEILDKDGKVVGGAEAGCYTDEGKWAKSPLYSLKSMAQTRATGKAYRQILSWVAVLAGYEPTPAEEMDGIIIEPKQQYAPRQQTEPAWKSEPASFAQISKVNGDLQWAVSGGRVDRNEFLKKHGVSTSEPLSTTTVSKGKASDMITELKEINTMKNNKMRYDNKYDNLGDDFDHYIADVESN